MRKMRVPYYKSRWLALGILSAVLAGCSTATTAGSGGSTGSDWKTCRDDQYGFSFRYPPDWHSTMREGRCVQLQKGKSDLPEGVPEVDVFIRVLPLQGNFPADYFEEEEGPETRGAVTYTDRRELSVNGLSAVRANFQSSGPTPNWGIEYAIRKGDQVLDIYISQPKPEVEAEFEKMIGTLQW